jgi:nitrite reductase (NO-forming)
LVNAVNEDTMLTWILGKLREWLILVVGIVIFCGGFGFAAWQANEPAAPRQQTEQAEAPPANTSAQKTAAAPSQPAPVSPKASAPSPAPSKTASAPAPAPSAANPPAPTQNAASAPAHNHAAPANKQQTAQSAPQPAAPAPAAKAAPAALSADAAAGRAVFRKCQACHSLTPGKNGVGPSLAGIIGKKAGSNETYNYSAAMKNSHITWDAKTLDAYLLDPQKTVPGNKMPFPGLKTDNERRTLIAYLEAESGQAAPAATAQAQPQTQAPAANQPAAAAAPQPGAAAPAASATARPATPSPEAPMVAYLPGIRYTLRSGIADGRMVFIGVGGTIDGKVNPVLSAAEGQVVQVTLINGEGAEHDVVFDNQGPAASSPHIVGKGASTNIAFVASKAGDYVYYCSLPGHRQAGMEGQFLVTPTPPPQTLAEADISQLPTDVPPPIAKREPQTVRVDLVTVELEARLAEGTTFGYWTFNGKVPGPMLRVRVGDTVEVHLKNADNSSMVHSVDFHAATGPGGGAVSTQTNPGEEKTFKFKALTPGLYVYHCATPMVAHHIANGMYGMILVEPEEGLPKVDHEFYVMQGEVYTEGPFGQHGSQQFDVEKLLNERPEYFVFNGSVGALSKLHPMQAKVGDTVRIFFGVGGPNHTSSFHVIGEIFDNVYNMGGVLSQPLHGVQTVTVPAGGAVITEFKVDVPGNYILVDHALSRMERGLVGILHVSGPANADIYDGKVEAGSGH